jgi:hypothetical protein
MNQIEIANAKAQLRQLGFKVAGKTAKINNTIAKKRRARSTKTTAKLEARIVRLTQLRAKLAEKAAKLEAKIPKPVQMRRRNGQMARCIGCDKAILTNEMDWRKTDNYVIELQPCHPAGNGQWYEKYLHNFCQPILERRMAMRKAGGKKQ